MKPISKPVGIRNQDRKTSRVLVLLKVVLNLVIVGFVTLAIVADDWPGAELINSPAGLWLLMFVAISVFVVGAWMLPLVAPIESFLKAHYQGRDFEKMARRDLWIGSTVLSAAFAMSVIISLELVAVDALVSLAIGGSAIIGSLFLTRWYHESQVVLDEES